jgi:hypothetical protein
VPRCIERDDERLVGGGQVGGRLVIRTGEWIRRGLVPKAKVHNAKVPDQDGIGLLPKSARTGLSGLKRLWLDAGYEGRGRRWAEEVPGLSVEVMPKPPTEPTPEEVARIRAAE